MNVLIKKLNPTANIPTKYTQYDACYDIYADLGGEGNEILVTPNTTTMIHTGFATAIPNGYFAAIFARSGIATKHNIRPSNCVGIIDASYRNEWLVPLISDGTPYTIHHGDRIAQFAILPVLDIELNEVNELSETNRGVGFGSSGK